MEKPTAKDIAYLKAHPEKRPKLLPGN